ncbi:MAG: apolipoprotein N-acyltransferase [Sneathiellales bacterium]|nr:apolipoprotein N-acyltransferase [Sneathiellales bacterium]
MTKTVFRLSESPFWQRALLSYASGLLLATAFAPLHLVFVLPLCFSALLILLSTARTKKQAFFLGWFFGWGQFMAGFYWIGVAFTIDANAHAALIPLPVIGLPAFLAIFPGLAALFTYASGIKGIWRVMAFTGFWVLAEYGRGVIFTGFPWNLAGYAWGNILPMLQWAAYVGIYGLTGLTVLISSLPSLLADKSQSRTQKNRAVLLSCALLMVMLGAGYFRLADSELPALPDSAIRLVQPNIPQADKWKPALKADHLKKLVDLSIQDKKNQPKTLIWPETAVPFFLTSERHIQAYLYRHIPENGTLVTGAPRKDMTKRQYFNSVQVLSSSGEITGIYDKEHLVPYGEYLPLRQLLIETGLSKLIPVLDSMSDFSSGSDQFTGTLKVGDLPPARTLICYEIAFPWQVEKEHAFDWILNLTNDGWFGDTSGPYQHLVISRTRAIEQGKTVIRAANTGISAVIDGYGRVISQLPLNQSGILDSEIPGPLENRTAYVIIGESPLVAFSILLIVLSFMRHRQITS